MTLTPGRVRNPVEYVEFRALTPPNIFPRFRPVTATTIQRFASSLCLLLTLAVLLVPVHSFGYQDEVDWMWNDTKATSKGRCKTFVVKAGPPKIVRGTVSGRTCLTNAIHAYRKGDHEKAFGWILAGQCHDRTARDTLIKNAPLVLKYLLEQYGPHVSE